VDRSWEYINRSQTHECVNVEIRAEAAQFPEKEYKNGIAVAVYSFPSSPDTVISFANVTFGFIS
jgi:hypothetical protein